MFENKGSMIRQNCIHIVTFFFLFAVSMTQSAEFENYRLPAFQIHKRMIFVLLSTWMIFNSQQKCCQLSVADVNQVECERDTTFK